MSSTTTLKQWLSFQPSFDPCQFSLDNTFNILDFYTSQMTYLFTTVPGSSINSWESWFIFNLWKINTNQWYESDSLDAGICTQYMSTRYYKTTNAYNYCTYLNSGLLEATRECVLHGLVPGLNWAPFWPLPMSMHLVATPAQYLDVSCNRPSFIPSVFCFLGGFSLIYK
jgi:hypothetical protein